MNLKAIRALATYDPETGVFRPKIGLEPLMTCWDRVRPGEPTLVRILGKPYQAHRLIWLFVHGKWPRPYVDHINCDPSDNRLCNLRQATPSQNTANSRIRSDNTTGYKGVTAIGGYFRARLCHKELGYFDTPEEAHAAYMRAAREKYGEFARAK